MGQAISPQQLPEDKEPEGADDGHPPCPACRGRGRKFVTLRRLTGAGGGASEDELLKRTQVPCLGCTGTGRAAA